MSRFAPALFRLRGLLRANAFLIALLMTGAPVQARAADGPLYSVNLESSVEPFEELPSLPEFEGRDGVSVYTTRFRKGEVFWHRLRLGPFRTREAAEDALSRLRSRFPQAWVTRLTRHSRQPAPVSQDTEASSASAAPTPPTPSPTAPAPPAPHAGDYVVHLESSVVPFEQPHAVPSGFEDLRVTTSSVTVDGRIWHRRNLGPFSSRESAKAALEELRPLYPTAWVAPAPESIPQATSSALLEEVPPEEPPEPTVPAIPAETPLPAPTSVSEATSGTPLQKVPPEEPPEPTVPAISAEAPQHADAVARRMARAGAAMTGGKNAEAIELYTAILALPESAYHPEALASLALALARQGRNSQARDRYREYLRRYPNTRGADRVRESLAALEGLPDLPQGDETGDVGPPAPEASGPSSAAKTSSQQPAKPSTPEEELALLMEEARQATVRGDYRRSIQLYTKVLQSGETRFAPEAQELLALSRERNGQLAHAKAEYERYLQLYPKGEGAERVQQRLQGLLTAAAAPRGKLRPAKIKDPSAWSSVFFGSLSQFYYRDETHGDETGRTLNLSMLDSDADLEVRGSNDRFDVNARFTGGYSADFLESDESETRISYLNLAAEDRHLGLSGRVGRQSLSTGGVLGRFDGALLSYQIFPKVRLSSVGGYPVSYGQGAEIDTDKRFYGFHIDWGTFAKRWDVNTFYVTQTADGMTDRRAVGGELRYFHPNLSMFGLVDYDIYHHGLNAVLVNGNWILPNQATFHASYNYRKSPFLTTTNALQGQGVDSLHDLRERYTDDEIEALAGDRTATLTSYALGGTYPLSSRVQVSADMTASKLSGTDTSGGVLGFEGTGWEYFYSAQLLWSDIFSPGDLTILGLRYSDTSTYSMIIGDINSRFRVTRDWRLNPRLRISNRTDDDDGSDELRITPSLLTNYRWRKRLRFEFEFGAEWDENTDENREDHWEYFLRTGYRLDF